MNDRELLTQIRAQIDAHLSAQGDGDPTPPVVPPPVTGGVTLERYEELSPSGDSHKAHGRTEAPGTLLWPTLIARDAAGSPVAGLSGTWSVLEGGGLIEVTLNPTNENGASVAKWWLGRSGRQVVRATFGGQSIDFVAEVSGGAAQPPVQPPVQPPPPATEAPPTPGPDSDDWTGDTIPVRIIEGDSRAGLPVAVTITADGESRTFRRFSIGTGRTIRVPRKAKLTVTAHVTPTPTAGVGNYGFTSLKVKAMNAAWGFGPDQIHHATSATWEPYTNNMVPGQPGTIPGWTWGGSLTTWCGSMPPGHKGPFWRYTIPDWVPTRAGVDFLVVWVLNHQWPREEC